MQNFEEFKKSRMGMDPTSRKLTDHQWEQAYSAYQVSQERVSRSESKSEGGSSKRRSSSRRSHSGGGSESSSTQAMAKGMHAPAALSRSGLLRYKVRQESAYSDLRFLVNILSYSIIALFVGITVFQIVFFTNVLAGVSALLTAALQVLCVVLLRLLVHVLIDIPDVMLYRSTHKEGSQGSES